MVNYPWAPGRSDISVIHMVKLDAGGSSICFKYIVNYSNMDTRVK